MSSAFSVRAATWDTDQAAIAHVRRAVFIEEQGVPEALEWEAGDPDCIWFVALSPGDEVIGIARLTAQGRIGRMAVLRAWRGQGVGSALLDMAVRSARARGLPRAHLSAQTHALSFYARHGFVAEGREYLDAGIPHRGMNLNLGETP